MATSCRFPSEDQFLCSICLDVFTEPVSTPCGHNFCKACLTKHLEGKEQSQCPLCNEKFNKGLKLCINTEFRDVVDIFKELNAKANNTSPVKPGEVPCDCCLNGNKSKASKTCLVCLTSFCETHLEPHLRVAALKRHTLTNPVHNPEGKICKKHDRILERFCRSDQTCTLCTEHRAHDMVPLQEAYVPKSAQMGKKKAKVKEIKHKPGKRQQKTKHKRKGNNEAMANRVVLYQTQDGLIWWIQPQVNRYDELALNRDFYKGRFYREVQAEWSYCEDLEVDRESMRGIKVFIPNPKDGNWVIRLATDHNSKDLNEVPVHLLLIVKPERVVVYVDYDEGLVSFCDADTMMLVYSFTNCNFSERIYLFYCHTEGDSWAQRVQQKVEMMKAWFQRPDTIFFFCCIAVLIFCSCLYYFCTNK
ncbi:uncharacterized protein LOC115021274 [Cottoperca gobio]|uniref:Uncharacterized protein LOC115021274 n=1 Tax=Cottoperca gobio TaxID=56716 RepID=A0A6J2RBD5_COTGO|nr:uncharacterized protein LOC115021274 [Cottoperca gobio]XP_029307438.1 uncharacterized protein LOC115021274 [Cottoperca gobio]